MAEEISDTSPNRQAYTQLAKEGYKGRFAANIADIRPDVRVYDITVYRGQTYSRP